jgi:hypothetical protein
MNWSWLSFMGFAAELVEYGYICRETWATCRCEPVCLDLHLYGDLLPVLHDAAEQCLGWRYRVEEAPSDSHGLMTGSFTHGRVVGRMWRWGLGWGGDLLNVDGCRHDEHGEYQGLWQGCRAEHDLGFYEEHGPSFWRLNGAA